jgi:hypothetical protein
MIVSAARETLPGMMVSDDAESEGDTSADAGSTAAWNASPTTRGKIKLYAPPQSGRTQEAAELAVLATSSRASVAEGSPDVLIGVEPTATIGRDLLLRIDLSSSDLQPYSNHASVHVVTSSPSRPTASPRSRPTADSLEPVLDAQVPLHPASPPPSASSPSRCGPVDSPEPEAEVQPPSRPASRPTTTTSRRSKQGTARSRRSSAVKMDVATEASKPDATHGAVLSIASHLPASSSRANSACSRAEQTMGVRLLAQDTVSSLAVHPPDVFTHLPDHQMLLEKPRISELTTDTRWS